MLCLPQSTINLVNKLSVSHRHPGLQLDKLSPPGEQTQQKKALDHVVRANDGAGVPSKEFPRLVERWLAGLRSLGIVHPLKCTTTGPLTLHLTRASALENAGICLHPLYGFVYLPGSGLKGMARAYAETVWLPLQLGEDWSTAGDAHWTAALDALDAVFGYAPHIQPKEEARQQMSSLAQAVNDRRNARHVRRKKSHELTAHVGGIVFHDAWPEQWPRLIVDIVNNHHPAYYQGTGNDSPPGDWENPVPVYFLAVAPGATFSFPLGKRRADVPEKLLQLAQEWLLGALCHQGAGAKTNTGYGSFRQKPDETTQAVAAAADNSWKATVAAKRQRAEFETTLELVTPAFLAGASQDAADCDLRPATLRGALRWWWRTMHAGYLDVQTLRELEATIWGDTKRGGAVRVEVAKLSDVVPVEYNKRKIVDFNDQKKSSAYGIPERKSQKTTQGLWYASYGMNENKQDARYVLEPAVWWKVRLTARRQEYVTTVAGAGNLWNLTPHSVLGQAEAALRLLIHYGGVGSKAGKGFGSLAIAENQPVSLAQLPELASTFRRQLNLPDAPNDKAACPSLVQMNGLGAVEVDFEWAVAAWTMLDQVGFAYSKVAQEFAHQAEKLSLGLPRQIHGPRRDPLAHQSPATHRRPEHLTGPKGSRHTSPIRIHLERFGDKWVVRVVAFPSASLPDLNASSLFLKNFLHRMEADLKRRAALPMPPGARQYVAPVRPELPSDGAAPVEIRAPEVPKKPRYSRGDQIKVKREEINGKVKFRADDGFVGHFAGESAPSEDEPMVYVANVNSQGYTFTMKPPQVKQRGKERQGRRK